MAKMNMFLHDYTDSLFAIGDTFTKPGFAAEGAGLKRFDYVVANPMWNQDNYDETLYENDRWKRFEFGAAQSSSADWGWLQHIAASLNDTGRAAVVLDSGAVSRGSGSKSSNKERTIRQAFITADLIEAVVLLPENLFYNTTAPGIVVVLNRNKGNGRKGQFLVINASEFFVKEKPKNRLTEEGMAATTDAFHGWRTQEKLSRVVSLKELEEADYNLSPALFVDTDDPITYRNLCEILSELATVRTERAKIDDELDALVKRLEVGK
jgi:type I restriction enzyme M protein